MELQSMRSKKHIFKQPFELRSYYGRWKKIVDDFFAYFGDPQNVKS